MGWGELFCVVLRAGGGSHQGMMDWGRWSRWDDVTSRFCGGVVTRLCTVALKRKSRYYTRYVLQYTSHGLSLTRGTLTMPEQCAATARPCRAGNIGYWLTVFCLLRACCVLCVEPLCPWLFVPPSRPPSRHSRCATLLRSCFLATLTVRHSFRHTKKAR